MTIKLLKYLNANTNKHVYVWSSSTRNVNDPVHPGSFYSLYQLMSNETLYSITDELLQTIDTLMEVSEEQLEDPEFLARFNQLEQIRATKLESCVWYLHSKNQMVDAIDARIKQLQILKTSEEKKSENFKKYLLSQMNRLWRIQVETYVGKISIRESQAVHIYDEDILPEEFVKVKTTVTRSPDKVAIKEALKNWEVPGASIQINQNLHVK